MTKADSVRNVTTIYNTGINKLTLSVVGNIQLLLLVVNISHMWIKYCLTHLACHTWCYWQFLISADTIFTKFRLREKIISLQLFPWNNWLKPEHDWRAGLRGLPGLFVCRRRHGACVVEQARVGATCPTPCPYGCSRIITRPLTMEKMSFSSAGGITSTLLKKAMRAVVVSVCWRIRGRSSSHNANIVFGPAHLSKPDLLQKLQPVLWAHLLSTHRCNYIEFLWR